MSTLEEISKSKVTVFIKPREGFWLSLSRDLVTLAVVTLCVYVSRDSAWWTLVTGLMFIGFVAAKAGSILNRNSTTFDNAQDAIEFLRQEQTP